LAEIVKSGEVLGVENPEEKVIWALLVTNNISPLRRNRKPHTYHIYLFHPTGQDSVSKRREFQLHDYITVPEPE
jgi:hypothetical protein